MADPERVLIVEDTQDTASVIRDVLTDEGYDAHAVVRPTDTLAEVRAYAPDGIALHLPPDASEAGALLDALRIDPDTRGVPLLATSTANDVVDAAPASYTVQETVTKPFDIDDLVARVERALRQPPIQALASGNAPDGVTAVAEAAVAAGSREMLLRLAERLRVAQPWNERPRFSLGEVLGDAPAMVDALTASLRLPDPSALLDKHQAAADRLLVGATERSAQGVDLPTHTREVALLRDELWALLNRELATDADTADVVALERIVNGSLDRIVALITSVFEVPSDPSHTDV